MDNIYDEIDLFTKRRKKIEIGLIAVIVISIVIGTIFFLALQGIIMSQFRIKSLPFFIFFFCLILVIASIYIIIYLEKSTRCKATTKIFEYVSKTVFSDLRTCPSSVAKAYYKKAFKKKSFYVRDYSLSATFSSGIFMQCSCMYKTHYKNKSSFHSLFDGLTFIFEMPTNYNFTHIKCYNATRIDQIGKTKLIKKKGELLFVEKDNEDNDKVLEFSQKIRERFTMPFAVRCDKNYVMLGYEEKNLFDFKERNSLEKLQETLNHIVSEIEDIKVFLQSLFIAQGE